MFSYSIQNSVMGFNNSNKMLSKYLEQLQTGNRINRAADDAAGMAIANQLKSQHSGISQAIKNANDGISITKIADSAIEEYTNILTTARSKAIQAANDTNSAEARTALENDVKLLLEQANKIATTTEFNGIKLLDGSFTNKVLHTGAYSGQTTSVSIGDLKTATLSLADADIDLTTQAGAEAAITSFDTAIKAVDAIRSNVGSTQLSLESTVRNLQNTSINIKAAEAQIREVDTAEVQALVSEWTIKNQASTFTFQLSQQTQQNILSLLQ